MTAVHEVAQPISHYSFLTSHFVKKHGFGQFCPKAVLFDMDGVIYDSMPNHSVSWHDAMKAFGLDMPYKGAYQYEGMRGVETIKLLAHEQWHRELSDEEAQTMYAHKAEVFARQCQKSPARIMPGIKELMGHSDIKTTMIYAKVIDKKKQKAVDLLDSI